MTSAQEFFLEGKSEQPQIDFEERAEGKVPENLFQVKTRCQSDPLVALDFIERVALRLQAIFYSEQTLGNIVSTVQTTIVDRPEVDIVFRGIQPSKQHLAFCRQIGPEEPGEKPGGEAHVTGNEISQRDTENVDTHF